MDPSACSYGLDSETDVPFLVPSQLLGSEKPRVNESGESPAASEDPGVAWAYEMSRGTDPLYRNVSLSALLSYSLGLGVQEKCIVQSRARAALRHIADVRRQQRLSVLASLRERERGLRPGVSHRCVIGLNRGLRVGGAFYTACSS